MRVALDVRSIACMDWLLGKLVREVDKLEGISGLLIGNMKNEDAVLSIHRDWLVSGGARIDWGVLVASKKLGVEKIGWWD